MTDDAVRCPSCGEPYQPGTIPLRCPAPGTGACPLAVAGADPPVDDPLGQTMAIVWTGERPPVVEEPTPLQSDAGPGGFPEVDDLVDRMLGQYRMGTVIGRGSMGRVYRAEHQGLGRPCAIKVMDPALVDRRPEILEQFRAEARAVAHLVHPHVVTIHNLGSDRGYHYIEMEYVPGGHSLKEALLRHGVLDPVRATALVRQVALGLGAAHRAGLVHRDVKLANVLLTPEGLAKLADFGLVHRLDNPAGAAVAGTPTYMAPELFAGVPAGPRTDLYAVGVLYYGLLAGRPPFVSDQIGPLIELHRTAPVPDLPPTVPEEVAALVARLLAKTAEARHASAEELDEDLQVVLLQLTDAEGLVRDSLRGLACQVQGQDGHYRVLLDVPGGRRQEVFIEIGAGRSGQKLVTVYSVCGPAEAAHYEFALRLNAELAYGGLSIRQVEGRPMFVMARAYPRGRVSPAEIRDVLREIARRGDWVEEQLTSVDVH
jgi:serine/threonine protein kinase